MNVFHGYLWLGGRMDPFIGSGILKWQLFGEW